MSKQSKKMTCKQKKEQFKTPANYYASKRPLNAVRLNNKLNEIAEIIRKNTKDLDPEFSKTVDEHFWDLV